MGIQKKNDQNFKHFNNNLFICIKNANIEIKNISE